MICTRYMLKKRHFNSVSITKLYANTACLHGLVEVSEKICVFVIWVNKPFNASTHRHRSSSHSAARQAHTGDDLACSGPVIKVYCAHLPKSNQGPVLIAAACSRQEGTGEGLGAPSLVKWHCGEAMAGWQEAAAPGRIQLCSPLHSSLARRGESIISKDVSICPSNFRLE